MDLLVKLVHMVARVVPDPKVTLVLLEKKELMGNPVAPVNPVLKVPSVLQVLLVLKVIRDNRE
jgi:hypothetical protein